MIKIPIFQHNVVKKLIDSGSASNLLIKNTFEAMCFPSNCLQEVEDDFHGIVLGTSCRTISKVDLMVYVRPEKNQRAEELTFKVANFESSYNCILG